MKSKSSILLENFRIAALSEVAVYKRNSKKFYLKLQISRKKKDFTIVKKRKKNWKQLKTYVDCQRVKFYNLIFE